ncbi:MAG: hypothetical protein ACT4PT_09805, partial [Methanobacteriota archaeon]
MRALLALALAAPVLAGCITGEPERGMISPTAAGAACTSPCPTIVDSAPYRAWGPFLAVNPVDPGHVVNVHTAILDGPQPATRARVSVTRDGGATWATDWGPGAGAAPGHPLAPYGRTGI